jgi:SRSO17 transposase
MLKTAKQRGIQFGYVGIDGGYGKEPAFLRGVNKQGCRFVADVHCDQTLYLQDPKPHLISKMLQLGPSIASKGGVY